MRQPGAGAGTHHWPTVGGQLFRWPLGAWRQAPGAGWLSALTVIIIIMTAHSGSRVIHPGARRAPKTRPLTRVRPRPPARPPARSSGQVGSGRPRGASLQPAARPMSQPAPSLA